VRLSPLGTSATNWPIVAALDDRWWVWSRGNRSTRRKPAPVPLCQPQIPHDLTRARTRTAVVGSRRLTAWAVARPVHIKQQRRKYRRPSLEVCFRYSRGKVLSELQHFGYSATHLRRLWRAMYYETLEQCDSVFLPLYVITHTEETKIHEM
jgi:hypothetical protein